MARPEGDKLANYLTMLGHLCADINQGALSAILPFLVVGAGYSYLEATMLLFASNIASGIIQPLFGWARRPPSLPVVHGARRIPRRPRHGGHRLRG